VRSIVFPILLCVCIVSFSCKDNVICPAFQSTYILNDSIRFAKYSYFLNDSTPRYVASTSRRTKYGVNKKAWVFKKNYDLKTAPKINVLGPPKKDSLFIIDQGQFLATDFVARDTTDLDSLRDTALFAFGDAEAAPKGPKYKYRYNPKFHYNQEQEYYNKYYGELLIDNRPAKKPLDELLEAEQAVDSTSTKKKGRFVPGFLKKKKDKKESDESLVEQGDDTEQVKESVPKNNETEQDN